MGLFEFLAGVRHPKERQAVEDGIFLVTYFTSFQRTDKSRFGHGLEAFRRSGLSSCISSEKSVSR